MTITRSLLLAALAVSPLAAQGSWERRELSIPMRDGVTLHAVVLGPTSHAAPLPILLIRTPFSADRELPEPGVPPALRELAEDGYYFVIEDVRGRGKSGGVFETLHLTRATDIEGSDEASDSYDTIDWLVKHLPANNGRVGVLGISYRGWLAAVAGISRHPALKAISPQAPMGDVWMGDDFFHNGAFRQTQGVAYAAWIEKGTGFDQTDRDAFDYFKRFPTLAELGHATGVDSTPSWTLFREHPAYDFEWQQRRLDPAADLPTLWVGGWWDAEDLYGPQVMYAELEPRDFHHQSRIVLGPWTHGGWARGAGDSIAGIALGSATAQYFRAEIQRPWFAHYLHDAPTPPFPEAWVFDAGEGKWHTFDRWPARGTTTRALYLGPNGTLSFHQPPIARGPAEVSTRYRSDPADPVPYIERPDDGSGWDSWMAQDQRFVGDRPDVRTWTSAPLTEEVTIAGGIAAHLFASTTGTDADWVVKLIDVYPDTASPGGYRLMVAGEIFRGRYRRNFQWPGRIAPNAPREYTIDLHQQLYRFRRGHRIMVQVQSSWFPLYDRNPQTFVPNIFAAKASDYRAADQTIWHSGRFPSRITFPALR